MRSSSQEEEDRDTLATPVYEKKALATFRGDTVVLGGTRSLFVQLLPAWLEVVTSAMDDFDLLVLKAESYFLSTLASIVGAMRLARLLMAFRLACDDHAMELHALRRQLHCIRSEIRLVLCYFTQVGSGSKAK